MPNQFDPVDMIISPLAGLPAAAVGHYATGILLNAYPAHKGTGLVVDPNAMAKYGPKVYRTIDNIYRECLETGRTLTLHVTWHDGEPDIVVARKQSIIIDPSEN
jgi:hypothetical protein